MKALLAIGCNTYDHINPSLDGAEPDASRIFDGLLKSRSPFYDPDRSIILRSPSVDEVRAALRSILFSGHKLDVLTFYFAGHGTVSNSSFYMCTRDTQSDALSATAFALADLFRYINEAKPVQTNIIIDACESGGLIEDLNVLLKGSLYGEAGTPGVTLFAASASNESAQETPQGGLATQALVAYITGSDFLRDDSPTLDLLEIGRRINDQLRSANQSPIMWGLNLYGPPQFCVNPKYSATDSELRQALKLASHAGDQPSSRDISALWRLHYALPESWNARAFVDALSTCLIAFGADENRRALLAKRYYEATCARVLDCEEAMRKAEVGAALLAALLPWLHERASMHLAFSVQQDIVEQCLKTSAEITTLLAKDTLALLRHPGGGLPDLFYHPLRLSKLIGWLALPLSASHTPSSMQNIDGYLETVRALISGNQECFTVVCEDQAPGIAISVSSLICAGETDLAEELLGYYFYSLTETGARIASSSSDGTSALEYMLARAMNDFDVATNVIAHPCETLAVVLRLGQAAGLDDAFDPYLWQLDGAAGIFFLTENWKEFANEQITSGQNYAFAIGREIFRIQDLGAARTGKTKLSPIERFSLLCTALIFPDRVPWFQVEELVAAREQAAG
jgi:Uncharacterized protein containing caspase domain